jgi:hypothetical protein
MDLISGFRSELFRPFVTLGIPGAISTGPYIIIVGHYFPQALIFWNDHPSAFITIIVITVFAVGLVLEDMGARIEFIWDCWLDRWAAALRTCVLRRAGSKRYHTANAHLCDWTDYLELELTDEIIGERYLLTIVMRMKFELAMIPSLFLASCGIAWLQIIDKFWTWPRFVLLLAALALLFIYLLWESLQSAKTLCETRAWIIEGAKQKYARELAIATAQGHQ